MLAACARREQPAGTTTAAGAKPSTTTAVEKPATVGTDVGSQFPDYTATRLDGSAFDIKDERNSVVLVNVWATWCGPCRVEIPELQQLHDRYASRGFKVIGVSVDNSGAEIVKPFTEMAKMTYPIVVDPDEKITGVLNISVLPTTVLLDRKGRILWKKFGAIEKNNAELKQAIEKAL
ncbi:MAG TPA: TlpA disulfide reductase family protein [Thermoanaerobaculia bacterium]|nr:TlpA disulfide reductase family protein [Thermoanaerobaculia bacterium]